MAHQPRPSLAPPDPVDVLAHVGRYALLVPEAALLLLVLAVHGLLGAPTGTALLGLVVVAWFSVRMGLLGLGRFAVVSARYRLAEVLLNVAHVMHPFSADTHTLLGSLWLARGRTAVAVTLLQRAVLFFPVHAPLHALLSGALLEADEAEAAFRAAQRALALDPQNAAAYLHLAEAEGRLDAPLSLIEEHLRIGMARCTAPADEAALRCALIALLIPQQRSAEVQLLMAGVNVLLERCRPWQRASLHYYLGALYRQLGEVEAAKNHFTASEQVDPKGRLAADAWRAARLS